MIIFKVIMTDVLVLLFAFIFCAVSEQCGRNNLVKYGEYCLVVCGIVFFISMLCMIWTL